MNKSRFNRDLFYDSKITMRKNIYFLDFENLQSTEAELEKFIDDSCEIYLFHGIHQNNFPVFWIKIASQLGSRLHIIQLKESANNALDFFISYYIGKLSANDNLAFNIVSNDKGYDPLIDHLTEEGRMIQRIARQKPSNIMAKPKIVTSEDIDPQLIKLAKTALSRSNRPKHKEKLINIIKSSAVFGHSTITAVPDITEFLNHLQALELITVNNMQVTYHLPIQASPHAAQSIKTKITQVLSPRMEKQIQNIFSKANRPTKIASLTSVIESSVITQKDNVANLKTTDVIQYLELAKMISIHGGTVNYHVELTQPLLSQNHEKCQKILSKLNQRGRPKTAEKYITSIKSWTQCTDQEARQIFKLLQKNNLIEL